MLLRPNLLRLPALLHALLGIPLTEQGNPPVANRHHRRGHRLNTRGSGGIPGAFGGIRDRRLVGRDWSPECRKAARRGGKANPGFDRFW